MLNAAGSDASGAYNVGRGVETSVLDLVEKLGGLGGEAGLLADGELRARDAPPRPARCSATRSTRQGARRARLRGEGRRQGRSAGRRSRASLDSILQENRTLVRFPASWRWRRRRLISHCSFYLRSASLGRSRWRQRPLPKSPTRPSPIRPPRRSLSRRSRSPRPRPATSPTSTGTSTATASTTGPARRRRRSFPKAGLYTIRLYVSGPDGNERAGPEGHGRQPRTDGVADVPAGAPVAGEPVNFVSTSSDSGRNGHEPALGPRQRRQLRRRRRRARIARCFRPVPTPSGCAIVDSDGAEAVARRPCRSPLRPRGS